MPDETQEFVHNGRKIVISQTGGIVATSTESSKVNASVAEVSTESSRVNASVAEVSIDGESIPVEFDPGTEQFIAVKHSPYLSHSTVIDLAKHVADEVVGKRSS